MRSVRVAETAFRWLMLAYPPAFRQAHGLALFELFRDDVRDACRRRGRFGVATAFTRACIDTLVNAPAARWLVIRRALIARLEPSRYRDPEPSRNGGPEPSHFAELWLGVGHDVRIAARNLRNAPTVTAIAIATLAVGVGTNLTIFSMVNAALLRPLAPHDPDRVVRVAGRTVTGRPARRFSYLDFRDLRARSTTLSDLAGVTLVAFVCETDDGTDQIIGEVTTGSYLSLLGVPIARGRTLTEIDDRAQSPPAVVISDHLWRRRFATRPDIVGQHVTLNRVGYTIVGVADDSFAGSFLGAPIDVWMPAAAAESSLDAHWRDDRTRQTLMVIGRLRPDRTAVQAQAELQVIAEALAREFRPELHPIVEVVPATLAWSDQRRLAGMFLSPLLGLVALVLVIACANVANLLLARILGRRRELAVRVALGATLWRLARLIAIEGVILSAAGGAAAVAVAAGTRTVFANITPLPTLTLRFDMRPDARVIGFALLATAATALALGGVGALHAIRTSMTPALSENGAGRLGGRSAARIRIALASLQIGASLMLLIGAALLVRSVRSAAAIDLGFDPRGVVALDVDGAGGRSPTERTAIFQNALRQLATVPGVEAAALATRAPLDTSTPLTRINAEHAVSTADDRSPAASFTVVSPRYFDAVKMPIVAGRSFTDDDAAARAAVAIVNETLARRLWPDGNPIGRRLWLEPHASSEACRIVGVSRNSRYVTLGEEGQGHVYLPFAQHPRTGMTVLVRSTIEPGRMMREVQSALSAADPHAIGFFPRTLTQHVGASLLPIRLATSLASVVAGFALALATVGLYGLVSFVVAERMREIALRIALGATPAQVWRLVVGFGLKLSAAGLAVGVPAALAGSRLLAGLLYGVSTTDPVVFALASGVAVAVALASSLLPASRAMRLDPIVVLKETA